MTDNLQKLGVQTALVSGDKIDLGLLLEDNKTDYEWSSSDETVAIIDEKGNLTEKGFARSLIKDYDNDTADGNDNQGKFTRTYGMEPTDKLNINAYVFNAHQSTWFNFCHGLKVALDWMYQKLENAMITKEGKDLLIGFNPKFLIDALRVIDDEEVTLYLMNPKAPCFIKDENETYIYLILPVNFNAGAQKDGSNQIKR